MIRKLKIVPLRFMIQFLLKILLIVDGYLIVLQGSQTVVIKLNDGSITSRHFDHVRICSCDSPNEIQDDLPIDLSGNSTSTCSNTTSGTSSFNCHSEIQSIIARFTGTSLPGILDLLLS